MSDRAGFVVATDELHAIRASEFETRQERDGFDAKGTTIDIIP